MRLRQLIREMVIQEKSLGDIIGGRKPGQGIDTDAWGAGGVQYSDKATTDYRRQLKRDWNLHADHAFIQDPKKFQVVHVLGIYSGDYSLTGYFPEGKYAPGKIPGIHIPNRNELSCRGFAPPVDPKILVGFVEDPQGLETLSYFTFKKYRVTLVAKQDAATEYLSNASPADIERMKGSGLAKRPSSSSSPTNFPIDEEGILEDTIEEVIIDNWIVDTCYGSNKENAEYAKKIGLKYQMV